MPDIFITFFFMFFAVILFVIIAATKASKKAEETWRKVSEQLRLDYSKQRVGKLGGDQRELVGTHRGFEVRANTFVESGGNNNQRFTRFKVRYPDLGLGLELKHQHFFANLSRKLAGTSDFDIGDSHFDDAVIIKAHSPEAVRAYLTQERRQMIRFAVTSKRRCVITDTEATWVENGTLTDPKKLQTEFDRLVSLAEVLVRSDRETQRAPRPEPEPVEFAVVGGGSVEERFEQARQEQATSASAEPEPSADHKAPKNMTAAELQAEAARISEAAEAAHVEQEDATAAWASETSDLSADIVGATGQSVLDPVDASTPQAEPAAPVATGPSDLDFGALSSALFAGGLMSFKVKEHFESTYKGQRPTWTGTLKRTSAFSSDLMFQGSGIKATIEMPQVDDKGFKKDVTCVVALPRSAEVDNLIGREVRFTGTLLACDGFMRTVSLSDGSVEAG